MSNVLLSGLSAFLVSLTGAPALGEPSLDEVRAAAERFKDVSVALSEGYVSGEVCETAEGMGLPAELGAMGIHFFRPDMLGISGPPNPRVHGTGTHTDFRNPAILLYEPQADGSLVLVGVENLVFADAWEAAGNHFPPSFHGLTWEYMEDDPSTSIDEAHGLSAITTGTSGCTEIIQTGYSPHSIRRSHASMGACLPTITIVLAAELDVSP